MLIFSPHEMKYIWNLPKKVNFLFILYSMEIQKAQPNFSPGRFLLDLTFSVSRMGISGTTAKSRQRKFVPSSHPGPFAVVATSRRSQTKVGTLACFDLL